MKTNVRDTSLESYDSIQESLGARQKVVYDAFKDLISLWEKSKMHVKYPTDMEVTKFLGFDDPNQVRPRRFELVKLGLLIEADKRKCLVTKRRAITWRVPDVS
jgi:hypothetical protein